MKKLQLYSELLKEVLNKVNGGYKHWNRYDMFFICCVLQDLNYGTNSYEDCQGLIKWINKYIKSPRSDGHGITAWLHSEGYITKEEMDNWRDLRFKEYRLAWLKDMIAYWESVEAGRD